MTDDRARKQAIRLRMQETGEKYTEARRAVAADSPAGSGERWLTKVFDPALNDEQIRYANVVERWRGAVAALEDCGVLDADQASGALGRLNEATRRAKRDRLPALAAPESVALPPTDKLLQAFSPMVSLVDLGGVTLVVVSVELWSSSVRLRIAGLHNATSDRFDEQHRRALERWVQKRQTAADLERSGDRPPPDAGEQLLHMPLALADDLDTGYREKGRTVGGGGNEWRLDVAFEPSATAGVRELNLQVNNHDGSPVHQTTLVLPRPE